MFGVGYIIITALIALRWRSRASLVALPALLVTVALFQLGSPHAAAFSSAAWCLAGLHLMTLPRNSELVAGVLYGISGLIYVALYAGASNATFAIVPVVSDVAFGAGLVAGTWGGAIAAWFRRNRRFLSLGNSEKIAQNISGDMEGVSLPDRGEG